MSKEKGQGYELYEFQKQCKRQYLNVCVKENPERYQEEGKTQMKTKQMKRKSHVIAYLKFLYIFI